MSTLENLEILVIANCFNFCITSDNFAIYFPFFVVNTEKIRKPHCLNNILKL